MITDKRFAIDFFEYSFLLEACIPPVPIARSCVWDNSYEIYHQLSPHERQSLVDWILHHGRFDLTNEECAQWFARFDQYHQYKVTTKFGAKTEVFTCYKYKKKYYTSKNSSIVEECITNIKLIP